MPRVPNSLVYLPLSIGLLFGCLTPTRGQFDLNFLPSLGVAAGCGLAALLAAFREDRAGSSVAKPPLLALAALGAAVLLTFVRGASPYPDHLTLTFGALAVLAVTVWLAGRPAPLTERGMSSSDAWLYGTALVAALLTMYAVFVQAGWIGFAAEWVIRPPRNLSPFGNFYQRNLSAVLMVIGIGCLLLWPGRQGRRWEIFVRVACAIALAVAIMLTRSRAGFGLVCLVVGYAAAIHVWRWRGGRSHPGVWVGAALLVGCCGAAVGLEMVQLVLDALVPKEVTGADGIQRLADGEGLAMRLDMMGHGLRQWWTSPWWGGGWGTHAGWVLDHATDIPWPRYSTNTHNLLSQLLAETGLVVTAIVVLAGVWMLVRAWRSSKLASDPAVALHWLVVGILGLHSMVEYPLWNLEFAVPFFWACARLSRPEGASGNMVGAGRVWGTVGALLLAGSIGYGFAILRIVDARYAAAPEATAQDVRRLADGIRTFGLSQFSDLLLFSRLDLSSEQIEAKRALGTRVIHFAPEWWLIERQAVLAAVAGDVPASADLFLRTCAMHASRCQETQTRLDQLVVADPARFEPVRALLRAKLPLLPKGRYDLKLQN